MSMADNNRSMAAAVARAEAIKRLQDLHPNDWERIYAEERQRVGLSVTRGPSALGEENRRLRQRIEELERQAAT